MRFWILPIVCGVAMSTYIYLKCVSHQPPIYSDMEVGQHTCDIDDIRKMFANKIKIVEIANTGLDVTYGSSWANCAARFLTQHPNCEIIIEDEYKKTYPVFEKLKNE